MWTSGCGLQDVSLRMRTPECEPMMWTPECEHWEEASENLNRLNAAESICPTNLRQSEIFILLLAVCSGAKESDNVPKWHYLLFLLQSLYVFVSLCFSVSLCLSVPLSAHEMTRCHRYLRMPSTPHVRVHTADRGAFFAESRNMPAMCPRCARDVLGRLPVRRAWP